MEESNTINQILKNNINNNLLKFSGHKVIGSSSSEKEEEENSSSSIEIEYEKIFEDEFHELVEKAEKKN